MSWLYSGQNMSHHLLIKNKPTSHRGLHHTCISTKHWLVTYLILYFLKNSYGHFLWCFFLQMITMNCHASTPCQRPAHFHIFWRRVNKDRMLLLKFFFSSHLYLMLIIISCMLYCSVRPLDVPRVHLEFPSDYINPLDTFRNLSNLFLLWKD